MIRVLLAKPGLDGHDRGIRSLALALRDSGAEVIYLGMRRSATEIMRAAHHEDVDLVGVSILSGAHLHLGKELLEARSNLGLETTPLVVGGTVPPDDAEELIALGVAAVFSSGSRFNDVVREVIDIAQSTGKPAHG